MNFKEFYYPSADKKTTIHACMWTPDEQPKGIIQIAHGVTEYIARYAQFAEYFTNKGYVVVGNDHIGHGKSIAEGSKPMYFGPEGSWNFVVKDVKTCMEMTKKEFPDLPYILMGFSLGSFVVRTFLIDYPNEKIDRVILMGTGQMPSIAIKIAKMMANSEAKKAGEENTTPNIHNLTFGTYNKVFTPNRTEYDWLCANEEALDEYIKDSNRGSDFSCGLFRELLNGMLYTAKVKNISKMNKQIPILLVSGDKDPVGDCGKGVKKTYEALNKAGVKNVSMKLYPGDRHDILHEKDKQNVYKDIEEWLKS